MPYETFPMPGAFHPGIDLPGHLDHRPIFAIPYREFDLPFAPNTDMRYLSVGWAQYDENDLSVKTMRYIDSGWSRQAEELPLHRAVDMTILLAKVIFDRNGENDEVMIPTGVFEQQDGEISVTPEQTAAGEVQDYQAAMAEVRPLLAGRLNALLRVLDDLRRRGRLPE